VEFLIESNDFKHSSSRLVGPTKIAQNQFKLIIKTTRSCRTGQSGLC